jgi:mycothiol synthase
MQLSIRSFTDNDYNAMHDIHQAVSLDEAITVEELQRKDQKHDHRCSFHRWVVEVDGKIVAIGEYDQDAQRYHPHVFVLDGMVHPLYQHQGIGSVLYTYLIEAIQPFHPWRLRKRLKADNALGLHFLKKRNFQEERRLWESHLDLIGFDPALSTRYEEHLLVQGIRISSLKDLTNNQDRDYLLYLLVKELTQDVPAPEPRTVLRYDDFVRYKLQNPSLFPEGYLVAIHNGNYIGVSELKATERPLELTTGLTAVKRTHRRRGIAHVLKVKCIVSAKMHGYTSIWTQNDTRNTPILRLNENLGFVKKSCWIELAAEGIS